MYYDNQGLFNNLKELAIIPIDKLTQAFNDAQKAERALHLILEERELLSDDNAGMAVSDLLGVPYINLSKVVIPKDLLMLVPEIVAKKQNMIVFGKTKEGLQVAILDPNNIEVINFLARKTGEKVIPYYTTEQLMQEGFNLYKKDLQKNFDELIKEQITQADKAAKKDIPTIKIIEMLIEYAYQNKASDIHIEPEEDKSVIRFRVDGILHDVLYVSKDIHELLITRVKVLSRLRTDEHMSAQDGKMQQKLPDEVLDIRVSIVPITEGEKCVLRLLSSHSRQFALHDLGMKESDFEKVTNAYQKPHGMVLSTGPTGSGKTTTIYGILKILNIRDINIATIEDPVEYDISGINQIQVNPKTNLTFADGLRAILRQDPNIIFVGEIRDEETAGIAVNSAMTGHLVLSTLHTNDAATALPRLVDMGVEPYLVASTVNVIIAQRLIRKICDKCRVSEIIKVTDLKDRLDSTVIKKYLATKKEAVIYHGKGCDVCHKTGYRGRVGVFEVLEVSPKIRDLITQKANSDVIQKQAITEGMTTMYEDAFQKVLEGLTSLEEVIRVTKM